MSLLAVVYQSLILFAGLFVVILTVSYASYKIKQKTNPSPMREELLDLQPVFAGEAEPIIPRNPYLNQSTHHPQVRNRKKEKKTPTNLSTAPRYTRIDTLYEEDRDDVDLQSYGRHSSSNYHYKTKGSFPYNNFERKRYKHSLDGYDILNYYDDDNEQQFYPFKTRF